MMSLKVKKLEMQKYKEKVEERSKNRRSSRDVSRENDDVRSRARTTATHQTRPTSILKNSDSRKRDKTKDKERSSVLKSFKGLLGEGDEHSKTDNSISRQTNRDSRTAKVSYKS